MGYRMLIAAAVAAHFAFLAYAVFGGFLAWRWPRTIWLHLAGAGWLLLVVTAPVNCPLTWAEDRLRVRSGGAPTDGFLNEHVAGVFYPVGHESAAQAVVALLVLTSWAGFTVRARRHRVPVG